MHNDDEALAEMMKKASVMLNLAEHEAGLHKDKRIVRRQRRCYVVNCYCSIAWVVICLLWEYSLRCQVVHAAADLEGHRGTDDRFYLLDFSRTFPPETPEDKYDDDDNETMMIMRR